MQASQHLEVLLAHPFFAAIVRMALQGKLRLASQRRSVLASMPRRLAAWPQTQRSWDHSFRVGGTTEREPA